MPPVEERAPAPAVSLTIGVETVAAEWLRDDPERGQPISSRGDSPGVTGVLSGWAHDRYIHLYEWRTPGRWDVAFLDAAGKIVDVQTLHGTLDEGVTSRAEARYALVLPPRWLGRRGLGAGAQVGLPAALAEQPPVPMPEIRIGQEALRAEMAVTWFGRDRGMMHRTALSAEEGMLFVYSWTAERSFWMGHCLIGLDIAFFDEQGRLLNVVSMDPYPNPHTDMEPKARSAAPTKYVLEVGKGWFRRKGLVGADGQPARPVRLEFPEAARRIVERAE